MYSINELLDISRHLKSYRADGLTLPRPLPPPFVVRLRDAWAVLRGRADAVRWEGR